jgi:hypothetical protein
MTRVHPTRRSRLAVVGTAGVLALTGSVVTALPALAAPGGAPAVVPATTGTTTPSPS